MNFSYSSISKNSWEDQEQKNKIKNNILLFDKQFGFQLNNSREYANLQLVNDISSSFKKVKYTLGIFIELPTISKLLEDCY